MVTVTRQNISPLDRVKIIFCRPLFFSLLFLLSVELLPSSFAHAAPTQLEQFTVRLNSGWQVVKDRAERSLEFSEVQVRGNYKLSTAHIKSLIKADKGVSFRRALSGELEAALLKDPWIHAVRLEWDDFPGALKLVIEESEPWFICHIAGYSWLASRQGKLIAPLQSITDPDTVMEYSELPRVEFEVPSAGTDSAGLLNSNFEQLARALKVVEAAGRFPFEIDYYAFTYDGAFIAKPKDALKFPEVVFRVETFGQTEKALQQLEVVLSDLSKRQENPKRIDLRYERQVVVGL